MLIPSGFTGSDKVPGPVSEVLYGQGPGNVGQWPRYCLLVGYKLSSSALADYEINDVTDVTEAINQVGVGSELAGMIDIAARVPGALLKYCAVPQPTSGAAAATATITIGGSWTTSGVLGVWLDEHYVEVTFSVGGTATTTGDNCATQVGGVYNIFCTAANVTGTVTLTVKNAGARGNDHFIWLDKRRMPAGATAVAAGGTAASNGAVPFTGGAGTDTIASITAATLTNRYDYSAWAPNEATSVDDIAAQAAVKAGTFGIGPENVVVGFSGTVAAAGTRSQVMNQQLAQLVHLEAIMASSKLAAALASYRSVREAQPVTFLGDPNAVHDFAPLLGVPGHRKPEHSPGRTALNTALNTGVTPIISKNGKAVICRSITSRSLNGALPDYSTLDTAAAVAPQRFREHVDVIWDTEHRVANPFCGPDPADGSLPPAGRSTPKLWSSVVNAELARCEAANIFINTASNPAVVQYNTVLKCLVTNVPCIVTPQNHQLATVLRQIAA